MARKVWVQGPIAIDSVVYLSQFPVPGSFMNSLRTEERTGGSSANVALGLCTASVETGKDKQRNQWLLDLAPKLF